MVDFIESFSARPESPLKFVLINLLEEFSRELNRLINGRDDLSTTCIQVRNILELYLISRHIVASEKGMESWIGQAQKDSIDIQNGLISLAEKHNNKKTESELKEIKKFLNKTIEDSDYQSKGGFNIRDLAEKYGHLHDYLAMDKLCSKLIHPTSIKVNAYNAFTENDNYLKSLVIVGSYFAHEMVDLCHEINDKMPNHLINADGKYGCANLKNKI